jgi:hypothetical protein
MPRLLLTENRLVSEQSATAGIFAEMIPIGKDAVTRSSSRLLYLG